MPHITFKHTSWVYLIVFLGVMLLHGIGHRYGLPYVENYDEARIFYNAAIQRGAAKGQMDLVGYPPMLFWMYGLIQPLGEQISHRPAELDMGVGVGILRALAVLANACSAVLMVWIARRITGRWIVGLLAAATWALAPDTLYNTVIALTEPFLILTSLLAFALALHALYTSSRRAALFSVLAALIAITFKYIAFPALGFGVVVTLWQIRQDTRWWRTLAAEIVVIIATAVLLFGVAGAGQLMNGHPETVTFTQHGLAHLLDGSLWNLVIYSMADQLRMSWIVMFAAAIVGSLIFLRRDVQQRLVWVGLLLFVVTMVVLTIAYITYTEGVYRYVAPLSPFIALGCMLTLWGIIAAIPVRAFTESQIALGVAFGLVGALWLAPILPTTASVLTDRTRPDTRAALAQWSLPILTEPYQNILQDSRDNRTFIRDRAGYQGLWYFQKWADPLSKMPDQWVAENTHWLMAEQDTQTQLTTTEAGKAWADKALLLKSFPPEGETWRGPALCFYRLTPPQQRTDIIWNGSVHLVGYDLSSAQADFAALRPGESFTFNGYWRAASTPTADLRQFIHVRPADDLTQVKTQADGRPVDQRPSSSWTDAQETLIGTPYTITLPSDLPAGEYVILVGLYDGATGARWTTSDGQDSWEVMRVTIR